MTSTERRRTWSERLDPRNWSLVAKLAVVGLVPTVLALTIGALQVVDQANVAEELGQGSGLVEAHQQVGSLTQALQAERAAAVTFAGGNRLGDRNAVDSAQAATDQAVTRAGETLAAAEQQAPQIATARRQADTTLGQLSVIRSQVAAPPTPAVDVTTRYTAVIQRTLALDRALLGQLQTADTAGLASALGSTASAGEALELERSVLGGAIAGSQLDEQQKALVNGAEATYQAAASDFQAALTPGQVDRFGNFATDPANAARQTLRDTIMATPDDGRVAADAAAWNAAVDGSTAVVRAADDQAEQQFVDGRAQAAERAGNAAGLNSVLLMLGLLLTVGIILLLGRQLVRSLRVLRSSALDVAERRLPQAVQGMRAGQAPSALVEPVPLETRDEIGEVARAFDAVHGQAIRLAADQAALQQNVNSMFVNLSRRSQALVERQLQLIEQLESNEQDPDQLSNLFQLDHLATRMRRNSENLLVLAGTDLTKRNVAPVQVVDVLRAAVSEVEQYQRVVVQTPPSATIAGRAANDVVHLLAELLDNATNFSPPDSQVVMSTTRTADESLLIEISDRGVGMADSELTDANQRLSGPSEVDVSASRRMGLFVVGRLAARHRVGVRLYSASGAGRTGGLSASVTVPPHLVPSSSPVVEQPPTMVGAGDAGVSASAPPVAMDVPEPVNGLVRNGTGSSMITGADGPVAPTFGSGNAGAPTRNGSAPKLPTRTPGSALRQNPGETGPGGSTNGAGAATNGSSVSGVNAFTPYGPTRDPYADDRGAAADMFAPAPDGPSTTGGYRALPDANGSGPGRDTRWPDGGRAGHGAGHETDGGQGGSDADGPDAAVPATRAPYETDDEAATQDAAEESGSWGTHEEQESRPADEEPGTPAASVDDDETSADTDATDGSGRTVLGTAAAVGAGGVFTGLVTRPRRETDEARDGQPDEDSGPATPEGDPQHAVHTGEAAADTPDEPDEPGDAVAPRSESAGAPTPSDAEPAAARSADADDEAATTTGRELPDAPDDADTDTAAFPSLRPPREPMGGPRPAPGQARPGPLRPAPARRPVMPGGPSPASRPVGSPAAAQNTGQFPAGQAPAGRAYPGRPPAARGDQDELFAPAVPVGDERGQLRRPGGLETVRSGSGYDISQTTPIFEEIASAWFRSNRSVPVRWQDNAPADNAPASGGALPTPGTAGGPQRPGPSPSPAPRPTPGPGPRPSEAPVTADHAEAGEDAGFASPADEVWRQAAAGAGDADDPADELTSAGLPKRRPRARLLPGSAAGSTVLSPPSSEARSAENVRGRLASYQQGVRQGRESASGRIARGGDDDPESGPADRPNPSDHEETT